MTDPKSSSYRDAGVDIDKGNAFIRNIKDVIASTHQRGVINEIGGFSSLFSIDKDKYDSPVLVSSTDGVGTKLAVAKMCGIHNTIGIDLVAMCANDIVVSGAKPLFFLDYFAVGHLDLEIAERVVEGIAEGCRQAHCSLVGGETAEMPGMYPEGEYDVAGFVTGIVDRDEIIDGSDIRVGNKIIGLASNGLHSNGFSLVRKICFNDLGLKVDDYIEEFDCKLGEALLTPTRIYVQPILNVLKNYKINGMVHNTGGGFYDNIPRILPKGCRAAIARDTFPVPEIFSFLADKGKIETREMFRIFNMGIGFMVFVEDRDVNDIMQQFSALGESPYLIGEIFADSEEHDAVEIN